MSHVVVEEDPWMLVVVVLLQNKDQHVDGQWKVMGQSMVVPNISAVANQNVEELIKQSTAVGQE